MTACDFCACMCFRGIGCLMLHRQRSNAHFDRAQCSESAKLLLQHAAHEPRPNPRCLSRRPAYVAAAVAVLLHCACTLLLHTTAREIASESFGTWSTANISQARYQLAATSLPNQGLAIFAGGYCTSCDCYCSGCRGACRVKGMWNGWACMKCTRGRSVTC